LTYHNSFLIADPEKAWVLETAGRQWAAERVRDVRSISNAITIGKRWDRASKDLVSYALQRGWCKEPKEFHFGGCYSDFLYTRFSDAHARRSCTQAALEAQHGEIRPETMMNLLRDHGPDAGVDWSPDRGLLGANVCMHAGFGPVRVSQSTGSMVSHLQGTQSTHWLTGTSAPCSSIFKPVWLDSGLPDQGPSPAGRYDGASLWWRHEVLHRELLRDYPARHAAYRDERDALEGSFVGTARDHETKSIADRAGFSARCFKVADESLQRWLDRVRQEQPRRNTSMLYRLAWRGFNRRMDGALKAE
jgi:dipeptidase